jgi:probable HAF family extracellular repeat protein
LGGVNVSCKSNTNLTSGWVSTVTGSAHGSTQGWGLIPIWVGLQAPCNDAGGYSVFGQDPNTPPYQQGYNEAVGANGKPGAGNVASGLGLSKTIIYYDMENYNTTNTTCAAEVESFVSGWVAGIHSLGYLAGVYANPAPVQADMSLASPQPDDIWITHFDVRATIFDPDVDSNLWPAGHRSRQYLLSTASSHHFETFDGDQIEIDRDIEDAPVAGGNGTKSYTYSNFQALNLGYDLTYANGINDDNQGVDGGLGQIAGYGYTSNSIGYLLDQDTGLTDITYGADTVAYGVNNPHQVVGYYGPDSLVGHQQGLLYDKNSNSYSTIDYLGGGAVATGAIGVNDDVQIVGWYFDGAGNYHGFLDDAGNFSSIDNSATYTEADGVNGVGQVVGWYSDSRNHNHAFLYQNGQIVTTYDCKGASGTLFLGINNNQMVTGMCTLNSVNTGFIYDYGHDKLITTFSFPGSIATLGQGVNDLGQIVGWWADAGDITRAYYATPTPAP